MNEALLSFSLGPVQDFIAAARTTRDLWTGSYLLSWLTAQAMAEVAKHGGQIISPDMSSAEAGDNPLFEAAAGDLKAARQKHGLDVLAPCLPQTFLARMPGGPESLKRQLEDAVRGEWQQIAAKVRQALDQKWRTDWPGWDQRWDDQVKNFWDIRVVVLPEGSLSDAELQQLTGSSAADRFQLERELLGRLAASAKTIRHYPPHEFDSDGQPDTRPKCSLLGSFAQMGPPAVVDDFWKGPRRLDNQRQRDWSKSAAASAVIDEIRLGRRDRFCAISLVKRFAWGAYFAPEFCLRADELQFPDADTICAGKWLVDAGIDTTRTRADDGSKHWSGHWLRWKDRQDGTRADIDDPEKCPDEATWNAIRAAKKDCGAPPAYYGVLMIDGDRMGELMRNADDKQLQRIGSTLAKFAREQVKPIVENSHHGKLVYAGGDDMLALLPPTTALAGARELAERFESAMRDAGIRQHDNTAVTCSGGLVIAHYKANLRDVLNAVRAAEHQAKQERAAPGEGRLTVCVLKRSGEHTSVSCRWPHVEQLAALAGDFAPNGKSRGESDRWAYHFRRELESVLPEVPELLHAELKRLLQRAEGASVEFKDRVTTFWSELEGQRSVAAATRFTQLIQSASFLARDGREER